MLLQEEVMQEKKFGFIARVEVKMSRSFKLKRLKLFLEFPRMDEEEEVLLLDGNALIYSVFQRAQGE
jgi:hypothetical protein